MLILELIIESAKDGEIWGRVKYDDNLIVENAKSIDALEKKMRKLLQIFHKLNPKEISFDISYEIAGFFDSNESIKATGVAKAAGISQLIFRQYTSGKKAPSLERVKQIEAAIHKIGRELVGVKIVPKVSQKAITTAVKGKAHA